MRLEQWNDSFIREHSGAPVILGRISYLHSNIDWQRERGRGAVYSALIFLNYNQQGLGFEK